MWKKRHQQPLSIQSHRLLKQHPQQVKRNTNSPIIIIKMQLRLRRLQHLARLYLIMLREENLQSKFRLQRVLEIWWKMCKILLTSRCLNLTSTILPKRGKELFNFRITCTSQSWLHQARSTFTSRLRTQLLRNLLQELVISQLSVRVRRFFSKGRAILILNSCLHGITQKRIKLISKTF
jgi:hypothetical protein